MIAVILKYKSRPNNRLFKWFRKTMNPVISAEIGMLQKQDYFEDILQAANIGLHNAIMKYNTTYYGAESFKRYVAKYVRGEAMKEIKRQKPLDIALSDGRIDQTAYEMLQHYSSPAGIEELEEYEEESRRRDTFYKLIETLLPEDYELLMDHLRGKSFVALADEYNTAADSIRQRYHRIINQLKERSALGIWGL